MRLYLTGAALGLLLLGCAPAAKSDVSASRVPKAPTSSDSTAPVATPQPAVTRSAPIPDVGWPAPFTYGNPPDPPTPIPPPAPVVAFDHEVRNILLLGSDRRPTWSNFRTDVVIVASVNPRIGEVVLLSIPRDLYVYLPGYSMQRINTAYGIGERIGYPGGGPNMIADTVRYNFGIPIHNFAKVEMDGFSQIVDTVGGIDVSVTCPYTDWRLKRPGLYDQDSRNWHRYTVPRGVMHMDGDLALWYARSRQASSDFDRGRRQQEVLRALYDQLLNIEIVPRIPQLYGDIRDTLVTDMSLPDLLGLAPMAARVGRQDIRSSFIGRDEVNSWRVPTSGAAVLVPKASDVEALIAQTFSFETPDELIPEAALAVEVINASGKADYGELAVQRLNYSGFDAHVGPRPQQRASNTELVIYGTAEDLDTEMIQADFRLAESDLVVEPDPESPFAFRLVVGTDYNPCFNPTRNQLDS